jgi:hypothetical protein
MGDFLLCAISVAEWPRASLPPAPIYRRAVGKSLERTLIVLNPRDATAEERYLSFEITNVFKGCLLT